MRQILISLFLRDIKAFSLGTGGLLPFLFFLVIALLYPFAVGSDPILLAKTGGGVLWIAALLSALLPLDRLILPDIRLGFFDQLHLRGISEELVIAVRLLAHWLSFAPLLIFTCFPAAILLNLDKTTLVILITGLLAGTPGLAAVGLIVSAITAGLRASTALYGLLLIPLTIPILIFGAGAISRNDVTSVVFAASISLFLVAITPFVAGVAIRAEREN